MDTSAAAFETAWARAEPVDGWLTRDQARVLHDEVSRLAPGARVVEIGSHLGRSTVVLASALPPRGLLTAVDPFLTSWRYAVPEAESRLRALLDRHGLGSRVDVRPVRSAQARVTWTGPVDLLYVDGGHDPATVLSDLGWTRHVPAGGAVLVHDAFSSVGVTLALLPRLTVGASLRYVGRTGSLARLQVGRPSARDRLRPWREMPWFARNVLVKVLLRLHAVRTARRLGHSGSADPF